MTAETRVEELLSTIRKAIDADLDVMSAGASTSAQSKGILMRGAMREMRVSFNGDAVSAQKADSEIAELRSRITRSRAESGFLPAPHQPPARAVQRLVPEPVRGEFSDILNGQTRQPVLRPSLVAEDPYEAPDIYEEAIWDERPQEHYEAQPAYAPQQTALVSPQTAYSAQASFENLADTLMARATGDRGIEDVTRDLLRGMLKTWLDDNLPDLVERLVREEIERVARRGR